LGGGDETDPPVISADLVNDAGQSNTDFITNDPAIAGMVTDDNAIQTFRAGFDGTSPANYVDIIATLAPNGAFMLDRNRLEQIKGGPLTDGSYTLNLLAADSLGNASSFELSFELDTLAPIAPQMLGLSAGSQSANAQTTAAARVSLVGQAGPNVFVELVETGAIAFTSNTGTFQIPNVVLSVGPNMFRAHALDVAGNTSGDFPFTITRQDVVAQPDPVLRWNQALLDAVRFDASTPPFASRAMAMVHSAIFDAVNAIEGKPGYYVALMAAAGTSAEAAVAGAAHGVLQL
jgi:hypothetical protein